MVVECCCECQEVSEQDYSGTRVKGTWVVNALNFEFRVVFVKELSTESGSR